MKTISLTFIAGAMLVSALAHGDTYSFTNSVGLAVPDANPTGLTASTNVSGLSGYISSVTVALDITGGFNGDLYAYLADPNGNLVVLLNRTGVTSGNAFGYGDTGFNIVLSSGGANIHSYQSSSPTFSSGQLNGTWAPDGRAIDPQSAPSVFNTAGTSPDLTVFNSLIPNGSWTLFIADLSGGGQSTLVSWGLTVMTVPEPQTWAMLVGGLGVLLAVNRRRTR